MAETVDVAVVGAGIIGLSVAWHLAQRDAGRVVVFERSGVGAEASGVQPGGVRQQWATRANCEMARESVAFYRELADRLEARTRPVLDACGYLFAAESVEELSRLRANVSVQNEAGVPSRIVSPGEAEELVPGLVGATLVGAAWCDEDGYFDKPQAVVEAFAEAAVRAGVEIRITEVTATRPQGSGWRLRTRDGSEAAASRVVLAAGYDAPHLVAPLGLELPIEKEARYLFFSDPIRERLLEPLVVAPERRLAAKQLADGRVLASDLGAGGSSEVGRSRWRQTVRAGVEALLPMLQYVSYPLLVEGFYDVTPDHQPVLGETPGLEGLWLAAGFSGHGFMMAPAVGRRLADALLDGPRHPSLDRFALDRFRSRRLDHERQIV